MKGTWETTDRGSGTVALVIGAAVLAAAIAGPVAAAVGELLRAVLIAAAVLAGLALAGGAVLLACRVRHGRVYRDTSVMPPRPVPRQAAEPLPGPRRPAIGAPKQELHLDFHGISAEDVSAVLARVNHEDRGRVD